MKTKDISGINSLEALQAEMRQVKLRIKEREADLAKRRKQLPGEVVKSAVSAILPAILGNQLGSGVWKLVSGLFSSNKSGHTEEGGKAGWKEGLFTVAKEMGFFSVFKLLSSLWKHRK